MSATRRKRFVNAYLGEAAGNAAEAARLAGYSEKAARQIGSRLLTYDDVRSTIDQRLNKANLSTEARLQKVAVIADKTPTRVTAADVLNANKLILQVNGALKDKQQENGITVNIGFLQVNQHSEDVLPKVTTSEAVEAAVISQELTSSPQVSLPASNLGSDAG